MKKVKPLYQLGLYNYSLFFHLGQDSQLSYLKNCLETNLNFQRSDAERENRLIKL
jgi:hypothetical protein